MTVVLYLTSAHCLPLMIVPHTLMLTFCCCHFYVDYMYTYTTKKSKGMDKVQKQYYVGRPRRRNRATARPSKQQFIFAVMFLLCGDVECNPGPVSDVVKCVCLSWEDVGRMIQCDLCDKWCHCKCVLVPASVSSTYPFVCPHCIKSSIVTISDLKTQLSVIANTLQKLCSQVNSAKSPRVQAREFFEIICVGLPMDLALRIHGLQGHRDLAFCP